jgi:acyl-CoA oxidase
MMFNHHRVPRDNLLDRYGSVTRDGKYVTEIKSNAVRFATMIGALIYGRVGLSFSSVAVSKLALLIAIKYGSERLQFGPPGKYEVPILDFLSHQRRLFIPLAKTYAYHFAMRRLLAAVQANDQKKLHILAAGMKAVATWHVNETLSTARQCCGGQGYLSENRIGELKADLEIYTTFEGDNVVLLQQVAASLLKEFREQFKLIGSALNFVAENVTTMVREQNPAKKRYKTKDHLLSTSFHHDALRFRKKRSTQILASQLRAASKNAPFFDAWNSCLDTALSAAIAHIDYVVFKAFDSNLSESLKTISGQTGAEDTKQLFKRLKNLYALSVLQQNAAFFLEEHYFAPSKAKAVNAQLNELCAILRPHAVALVDSFDIPDFFVPPLGKSTWVEHNQM